MVLKTTLMTTCFATIKRCRLFFKVTDRLIDFQNSIKISLLSDKNHEAVRDLESLRNNEEDVGLGAMIALLYTHKKFATVG